MQLTIYFMESTLNELRDLREKAKVERKGAKAKFEARAVDMAKMHLVEGRSLAEVAKAFGCSRQRVHQLIEAL